MRFFLLVAAVVASALGAPNPGVNSAENDINYHFYCRRNPTGILVHSDELKDKTLLSSVFDPTLETVVLFHGWKDNYGSDSNTEVRSALLEAYNVNVIKIDWGPLAGGTYLSAKSAVPTVGRYGAKLLAKLNKIYNYSYDKVTVIGFSLGAHAAGNLGAALNGSVAVIVGLDPAGPLISYKDTDYALDTSDAKYVHVVHTNTDFCGMSQAIGHSDYYPNGGGSQPGCGLVLANSCAHNRAWAYLVESFTSKGFVATKCGSYRDFTRNRCTNGETRLMGGFPVDKTASGVYYLTTNSAAPWARG